jgi:4-alpha-glucanotransferase
VNSLARRPESYHAKLKNLPAAAAQGAQSIHEQTRAKEAGLDRWLNYDRWARHCFRLLLFSRQKKHPDCGTAQLAEDSALAGGPYRTVKVSPAHAALASEASMDWPAEKTFSFANSAAGFGILCDVTLRRAAPGAASVYIGIEAVLNFLAPFSPDRYFESAGERHPLRWSAASPGSHLRVVDEWQGVSVTLTAPDAQEFWITPIETVSESEEGFERIYQGSQIVAVWPVEIASGAEWRGQLDFNVARLG